MPTYCYRVKSTGEVIERSFSLNENPDGPPRKIRTKSGVALRDIAAEHIATQPTTGFPILSDAAGVHPSQIPEAKKYAESQGCPTDFTPDGRAVLRTRAHRAHFLRAHGMIDRNGGYGDG